MKAWTPTRSASLVVRGSNPDVPAWLTVDARRSIPAQNEPPVPVTSRRAPPVGPGLADGGGQVVADLDGERVARLGPVQGDAADVVGADAVVDHRRMLTGARLR